MSVPLDLNRKTSMLVQIIQVGTSTVMAQFWYTGAACAPVPRIGEIVYLNLLPNIPQTVFQVKHNYSAGTIEVWVA
jgi:hypothetical protein